MTTPPAAPMPASIRQSLGVARHPARTVPCAHCGAHAGEACRTRTGRRGMPEPHPSRITAWAQTVAVCPTCQVTPGTPCHHNGWPVATAHPARVTEAERTAA